MIDIPEHVLLALEADDRDRLQRILAAGDPADFALLRAVVEDDDAPPEYRRKAMYALGRWSGRDDEAVETIASVLPGLGELERITAVNALGRIGSDAALEVTLRYAEDDQAEVRRQVVKSLDRIGSTRAVEALRRIAEQDPAEHVRDLARARAQAAGREKGEGP